MSTTLIESIHKSIAEIEKCQQPFAWILPWAQTLSWVSCSFHSAIATTFLLSERCEKSFSFLLSERSEKCSRGFLVFRTLTPAWYFGATCMIPRCFFAHLLPWVVQVINSCYHCWNYADIQAMNVLPFRTTSPSFQSHIPCQATFDITCTPHLPSPFDTNGSFIILGFFVYKGWFCAFSPTKTKLIFRPTTNVFSLWIFVTAKQKQPFLAGSFCCIPRWIKRG